MAHYAFIDSNNVVVEVIVGVDEDQIVNDIEDWEKFYETQRPGLRCLRTSYNTLANQHIYGGTPFRGNYAGIGYSYLEEHDIFMPPKPFESWILDLPNATWIAPVPYPADGTKYQWDEVVLDWKPWVMPNG